LISNSLGLNAELLARGLQVLDERLGRDGALAQRPALAGVGSIHLTDLHPLSAGCSRRSARSSGTLPIGTTGDDETSLGFCRFGGMMIAGSGTRWTGGTMATGLCRRQALPSTTGSTYAGGMGRGDGGHLAATGAAVCKSLPRLVLTRSRSRWAAQASDRKRAVFPTPPLALENVMTHPMIVGVDLTSIITRTRS
jgi:hypothetical protein